VVQLLNAGGYRARTACRCGVCILTVPSSVFCYVCAGDGKGMVVLAQDVKHLKF
jgi:hypothetical protein